jgi:hypothetical protein
VWADVRWDGAGDAGPALLQDRYGAAIGDGQVGQASRFAEASAWVGRSTSQWRALAGGVLVARPLADGTGEVPACRAGTAGTDPLRCGTAVPAEPALPRRVRGVPLAIRLSRRVRPPAGPEVLRRVIDGLNRL